MILRLVRSRGAPFFGFDPGVTIGGYSPTVALIRSICFRPMLRLGGGVPFGHFFSVSRWWSLARVTALFHVVTGFRADFICRYVPPPPMGWSAIILRQSDRLTTCFFHSVRCGVARASVSDSAVKLGVPPLPQPLSKNSDKRTDKLAAGIALGES